jgi:hypothetical protein
MLIFIKKTYLSMRYKNIVCRGEPMCSPFYGEEQFMSYGKFERIEQVSDKFGIKVKRASFIEVKDIKVDEFFLLRMGRALLKEKM